MKTHLLFQLALFYDRKVDLLDGNGEQKKIQNVIAQMQNIMQIMLENINLLSGFDL